MAQQLLPIECIILIIQERSKHDETEPDPYDLYSDDGCLHDPCPHVSRHFVRIMAHSCKMVGKVQSKDVEGKKPGFA